MLARPLAASAAPMMSTSAAGDTATSSTMSSPARIIVLSGPSGGGKSTILTRAMESYPGAFSFSVSHTTRKPRDGELHGTHYYFVNHDEINAMIAKGEFLEYANFGGNTYGTSKAAVEEIASHGKICVLDLELQGVRSIKASHLKAKYILITPPSIAVLEERLRKRATETEETLQKRLKHAEEDLLAVKKDSTLFDHVIINDDLDEAYEKFVGALHDQLEEIAKKE